MFVIFECSGQDTSYLKWGKILTDSSFYVTNSYTTCKPSYFTLSSDKPRKYCPVRVDSETPKVDYYICRYGEPNRTNYPVVANSDNEKERWDIQYINGAFILHRYGKKPKRVSKLFVEKTMTKFSNIY